MQPPFGSPLPPPFPPSSGGTPTGMPPQSPSPMYYPPPMMYPSVPSRGGGFVKAIFTTLAVAILGCSVSLNFYFLVYQLATSGSGSLVDTTTLTEGDEKNTIAVVPIEGFLSGATVRETDLLLKSVEADASVKALVVQVDTPGGEVTASDELYERLLRFKREQNKPVVVSMGGMATSGGYYISCAADHVVAQRTTITGNIGVLLPKYNLAKLGEKYGIEDDTTVSTGTPYKNAGSMFKDDTPEQKAYWQGLADGMMATFKDVVRTGRNFDAATVDKVANGQAYMADEALKLKLVDSIGYLDTAIADATQRAGLTGASYRVVKYSKMASIWDAFGGSASSASSSSAAMLKAKVGDIEVGVDHRAIHELLSPRPRYLWQGH